MREITDQKKLRIWTLFTQCVLIWSNINFSQLTYSLIQICFCYIFFYLFTANLLLLILLTSSNRRKPLTIFAKSSILDGWQSSKCASKEIFKKHATQKGGREFIKNTDKNDKGDRGCSQKRDVTRSKFFCAHVFATQFIFFISPW